MSVDGSKVTTSRNFSLGIFILVAIAVAGVWAAFAFVEAEKRQDIKSVGNQLRVIGESRASAISNWIDKNMEVVDQLASNESLQVYLTNIVLAGAEADGIGLDHPEADYLRNYLKTQAVVTNFWSGEPPKVTANVTHSAQSGLALLDVDGNVLVASNALPEMSVQIRQALVTAAEGKPAYIDMFDSGGGGATLGFMQPVFAVQGDEELVGFVIGLKLLDQEFFALLKQPGNLSKTGETIIVQPRDGKIVYLSPLRDGAKPFDKTITPDPDLAATFAITKPHGFSEKLDYSGEPVFVTAERIERFDWTLIRKIDVADALAVSNERGQTILVMFLLILGGMAVIVVAVWRHGTSVKAVEAANRFRALAEEMERTNRFMTLVTNNQPTSISVLDSNDRYTFTNRVAAKRADSSIEDMLGKSVEAVLGASRANTWAPLNREARLNKEPITGVRQVIINGEQRTVQSEHIPLGDGEDANDSLLLIQQDITDLLAERQKSEKSMRDLVDTLVGLVDQRDPHSANQSARVNEVAISMAKEMSLTEDEIKTVDIVSNVMNLGKIFVPTTILQKTGTLTAEEQQIVQDSLEKGAALLDKVDFNLPISDTMGHLYEKWDGSGHPNGIAGEEISVLAQIVAVANAFVSMVSARSYRDAMPVDKAVSILFEDIETKFHRRPVSALLNCLDNKGARKKWAHFGDTM